MLQVSVTLKELGLDNPTGYHIEDLYDDHVYGIVTPDRRFKVDVNPSGSKYSTVQTLEITILVIQQLIVILVENYVFFLLWRVNEVQ